MPVAGKELRPGIKTLLEVLNGRLLPDTSNDEWDNVLSLAEEERISPWFVSRLRALAIVPTPELEARLRAVERESTIAAFFWCGELKGLLRAFHEEGVPVIPLKGPVLAERVYGDVSLRSSRDLDLLVRKVDFARSQALLTELGFVAKEVDRYHQSFVRGTTMVELHDDVVDPRWFNFHIDAAWEQARPTTFQDVPTFQLSAEDDFLFLALHGVRHEFDRLTLLLDMALAPKAMESRQPIESRAEVASLGGQLLLGYMLARRLLPSVCPELMLPTTNTRKALHEALAAQLENRILIGDVAPLHWRQRNRLHRDLELSMLGRANRIQIQLGIRQKEIFGINEKDRRFSLKFGFKRRWYQRLLRPIRIFLKVMGRYD